MLLVFSGIAHPRTQRPRVPTQPDLLHLESISALHFATIIRLRRPNNGAPIHRHLNIRICNYPSPRSASIFILASLVSPSHGRFPSLVGIGHRCYLTMTNSPSSYFKPLNLQMIDLDFARNCLRLCLKSHGKSCKASLSPGVVRIDLITGSDRLGRLFARRRYRTMF